MIRLERTKRQWIKDTAGRSPALPTSPCRGRASSADVVSWSCRHRRRRVLFGLASRLPVSSRVLSSRVGSGRVVSGRVWSESHLYSEFLVQLYSREKGENTLKMSSQYYILNIFVVYKEVCTQCDSFTSDIRCLKKHIYL